MKKTVSVIAAAVLLLAAAGCGRTAKTNADNGRLMPTPAAAATARPMATAVPGGAGSAMGDAARDAGSAVGRAAEDAGNAVGDTARGAGNAVGDLFGGDTSRTGTGLEDNRATPKP